MSKKSPEASSSSAINLNTLSSYRAACEVDAELQSFDTFLQTRTNQVINTIADGVEVRALSFDSFKEVIECLLEMNQEVVKVVLECKEDIWKNKQLFELVDEYFQNSLHTLEFCTALDNCLKRASVIRLLTLSALEQFQEETKIEGNRYARTLEELKKIEALGDPFTEEFFQTFQSVYRQQTVMLDKLQLGKNKLDKKLKKIHFWRKVTGMIFMATLAVVLICSVVAAAIAAPPAVAALASSSSDPVDSAGKWIDSLWENCENALKDQKEVIISMQVGTCVAIEDLRKIRGLIDGLKVDSESLLHSASSAVNEDAVKAAIEEIKNKLGTTFTKNMKDLGTKANICSCDIRRARTVVLQRIIKHP